MTTPTPLPCPFCGSLRSSTVDDHEGSCYQTCHGCDAEGPTARFHSDAVKFWNRALRVAPHGRPDHLAERLCNARRRGRRVLARRRSR